MRIRCWFMDDSEITTHGESYAKFSMGSKELKKVVSQLIPMFKGGFEATPRVLFKVNDRVKVYATNNESYTEIVFDCNIQSKGEFVVSGEKFAEIIKSGIDGNNVELSVLDNNSLMITDGIIDYRISLIEADVGYLQAPNINDAQSFTINAQAFKNAISSVSCCIDSAKAHLNCIMVHSNSEDNNSIFVVATDGMRLGVATSKTSLQKQVPNLMIPKKAAEYIITMIGEMQGDITVKYTDNMIQVSNGSILYTSKLLDTSFPKYQSVIPANNNNVLEVKTKDLNDKIKRMKSISDTNFRVKLVLLSDKIEISCSDDNGGVSNTTIEATYSSKDKLEVVCNYRLLCEILDEIKSTIVRMQFLDSTTPILIRSVDDETVKYVFMPFVS